MKRTPVSCSLSTLMTHLGTKIFRYQEILQTNNSFIQMSPWKSQSTSPLLASIFFRIIADVIFSINHQVSVNLKRNITCSMCIIVEVFQTQMQQSQLPFQIIIRMSPWKSQSTSPLLTYASSLTYLALVHHLSNSKDVVLIFYSSAFGSFFNCRSQQFS